MVSQTYVDGITDTVSHGVASTLTAGQIAIAAARTRSASRWSALTAGSPATSPWSPAVTATRSPEVAGLDVCIGEVTIKLPGS